MSKNPMMTTNPMMSINPMMTSNPMMTLMANEMNNQLQNSRMSGRTDGNSGMVGSNTNSDTTIRVPSVDEVLSSAMMEALGQTAMPAYPYGSQLSRFFGSSYF
jgi:hypothetical protein